VILDRLASGALSLTTVRVLSRHLTEDNHEAVLARAQGRTRRGIDALVAELAPRPDVPPSVRRLPTSVVRHSKFEPLRPSEPAQVTAPALDAPVAAAPSPVPSPPTSRAIVQSTAPERYRIQFTVGQETHEKLRRLQTLLRREIPDGDPAAICDRAWSLLLERVEKAKLGAVAKAGSSRPIRPGTDKVHKRGSPNRHVPRAVKRTVWERDAGQCAFVSAAGLRCPERTFLEFHHQVPFAKRGPATVANITLRCRRHNQYEADLVFGPRGRDSRQLGGKTPAHRGLASHGPSLTSQPRLV
jgi:5-methylcytosine-specific restriction endonuclease McrA